MKLVDDILIDGGVWIVIVAAGILLVVVLVLGPPLDRGAGLARHTEHHHTDAYLSVAVDFDGNLAPEWHDEEDWDTTVCDQWEFPNGKAERD